MIQEDGFRSNLSENEILNNNLPVSNNLLILTEQH